jgi:hypothetical protein
MTGNLLDPSTTESESAFIGGARPDAASLLAVFPSFKGNSDGMRIRIISMVVGLRVGVKSTGTPGKPIG